MVFFTTTHVQRLPVPILIFLLTFAPYTLAQQPAQPDQVKPIAPLPTTQTLKIIVLSGQKEKNDLERRVMAPLVVQVLDQSDNPVEGAEVAFRFPLSGPSATFEGDKTFQSVRTDSVGQARATGWMANRQTGSFQVLVTATLGNQMGQTRVTMTNAIRVSEKERRGHGFWTAKKITILVLIAAGGVAAGVLLTRGSSSTSSPTTVTISPGTPTLGGTH